MTTAAAAATLLMFSPIAFAQQGQLGTAQEARAMFDKAVAALKADREVALAMFNKGEGGFRDRDLNAFCFRMADGKAVASPIAVPAGTDARTLKDPTGKAYGEDLYAAAQKPEGQITEVGPYMFPKPGTTAPAFPKVSFVTRVVNLVGHAVKKLRRFKNSLVHRVGRRRVQQHSCRFGRRHPPQGGPNFLPKQCGADVAFINPRHQSQPAGVNVGACCGQRLFGRVEKAAHLSGEEL
jgi:hypothetical protein